MQLTLGNTLTTTLADQAGGIVGLGARIEAPVTRAVVVAWRPATLDGGLWTVELESPPAAGDYVLVWRTSDPEPPDFEAFIPLTVLSAPLPAPPLPLEDWRPTVADVAAVSPAYTRHDVDAVGGGAEAGVFDDTTDPTAADVDGFITTAVGEVSGRVGVGVARLGYWPDLAKATCKWHAAAAIEAEKAPEGTAEAEGAYRWKQASYVACLNELVNQARHLPVRLV